MTSVKKQLKYFDNLYLKTLANSSSGLKGGKGLESKRQEGSKPPKRLDLTTLMNSRELERNSIMTTRYCERSLSISRHGDRRVTFSEVVSEPSLISLFHLTSHLANLAIHEIYRDFIHNSLYNPFYGYFSIHAKVASIPHSPPSPSISATANANNGKTSTALFDFNQIKSNDDFLLSLSNLYSELDHHRPQSTSAASNNHQLWHTPTEIFQPFYGFAIAKYIVKEFFNIQKRKANKMDVLKIVEIGAGNGTLMKNILGYLKLHQSDLYNIAQYNIIEISPQLAQSQRKTLQSMPRDAANKVSIINKSIFDYIPRSGERDEFCFFIAMEVLDNLAHDYVRFDVDTGVPVQGMVLIDEDTGDFEQVYEPVTDSLLKRYLETRSKNGIKSIVQTPSLWSLLNPFKANLTHGEYIPSNAFKLLELVYRNFPNHHLIMSDFHQLPRDEVVTDGVNGPIVQTRYQGKTVPCSTYMVDPGYFDIFFPTNFNELALMYQAIGRDLQNRPMDGSSCNPTSTKELVVYSHGDFLNRVAGADLLSATSTQSGENPMLEYYENVSFIVSK